MSGYVLREVGTGRTIASSVEIADSFWTRFVGLQGRSDLASGHGLLIVPCASIHTCFVRFALDVIFLDATGRVLAVRRNVRPWRVALAPKGTFAILEQKAGNAPWIENGTQLEFAAESERVASRASIHFLMGDVEHDRATEMNSERMLRSGAMGNAVVCRDSYDKVVGL